MSRHVATIVVPGEAKPQGSLRSFKHPQTGAIITPQDENVITWRGIVRAQADREHVFVVSGPVALRVEFTLRRPKSGLAARKRNPLSVTQLAAKRPDVDKLARAVLDALEGVWYSDDAQVVDLHAIKVTAEHEQRPQVAIHLFVHEGAEVLEVSEDEIVAGSEE